MGKFLHEIYDDRYNVIIRDPKKLYITEACECTVIHEQDCNLSADNEFYKKLLVDVWIEGWNKYKKSKPESYDTLYKDVGHSDDSSCIWWHLRDINLQIPK